MMKWPSRNLLKNALIAVSVTVVFFSIITARVIYLRSSDRAVKGSYTQWFKASQRLPFSTTTENELINFVKSNTTPQNQVLLSLARGLSLGRSCESSAKIAPRSPSRLYAFISATGLVIFIYAVILTIFRVFNANLDFNPRLMRRYAPICLVSLIVWLFFARIT
ncbi:hypothetical protein KKF34_16385 [Myxococcota bacterium]|nr:hypothetical protein [Myxococcota bacterium]MBU1382312.1 hypothetical protein [Myxococcota bacterium]MBU1498456.1 hypothetical protein [Myxococcota bacterium]